jgi:SAM-dependent methyltransferase
MCNVVRFLQFTGSYLSFKAASIKSSARFLLRWRDRFPCLDDASVVTPFDAHYVYHTAWAARVLAAMKPSGHVDISSSLYFNTLVSAFIPVRFFDYRPAKVALPGLSSAAADLMKLPFTDNSIKSLSCMHVVEHIGLGRYGDALDPEGDVKAARELARVLAPGGTLLFVVPVGRPRICFNAHRIYSYAQVKSLFPGLIVREFALIPDNGREQGLVMNAPESLADEQVYACGCFRFEK